MNIYIEIDGLLGNALRKAISIFKGQNLTGFANAKLVIIETTEALARLYTPEKYFVLFNWENPGALPINAEWHYMPRLKLFQSLLDETKIDQKINCQKINSAKMYRAIALLYFKKFVDTRLSFDVWVKNTGEPLIWMEQKVHFYLLIRIVKHIVEHREEIECGDPQSELAWQINKLLRMRQSI